MKKENILELKNHLYQQIQLFELNLLDTDSIARNKLNNLKKEINRLVDEFVKLGGEDIDLWVFLNYVDGKLLSKTSKMVKVEPVTLRDALANGFKIPETATIVEFGIKPVWKNGYNRYVEPKNIYEIKFGLNNGEEVTETQLKRRYKLTAKDNLYSVEDLKENSKILKFFSKKKRTKQSIVRVQSESGLGL